MEGQLEFYDMVENCMDEFGREMPGVIAAGTAYLEEVYKDGALSHKVKRLMALVVALQGRCGECVVGQTRRAVEAGATKEEILETVALAPVIGGTISGAVSWRAIKALQELGKW